MTSRAEVPLERVVAAAARLETAREELQAAVEAARSSGASWAEVGAVLGTSRQAAFKRFARPRDPRTGEPMTVRSVDHVPALVEEVFRRLDDGDYAGVRARMPDEVAAQLTEDVVLGTWARVVGAVGNLEGFRGSVVEHVEADGVAAGTVVGDTTLLHEAGEMRGRVALDPDDRVVGLLVVAPGTPDLPF